MIKPILSDDERRQQPRSGSKISPGGTHAVDQVCRHRTPRPNRCFGRERYRPVLADTKIEPHGGRSTAPRIEPLLSAARARAGRERKRNQRRA